MVALLIRATKGMDGGHKSVPDRREVCETEDGLGPLDPPTNAQIRPTHLSSALRMRNVWALSRVMRVYPTPTTGSPSSCNRRQPPPSSPPSSPSSSSASPKAESVGDGERAALWEPRWDTTGVEDDDAAAAAAAAAAGSVASNSSLWFGGLGCGVWVVNEPSVKCAKPADSWPHDRTHRPHWPLKPTTTRSSARSGWRARSSGGGASEKCFMCPLRLCVRTCIQSGRQAGSQPVLPHETSTSPWVAPTQHNTDTTAPGVGRRKGRVDDVEVFVRDG
jgi:hypothetical protein